MKHTMPSFGEPLPRASRTVILRCNTDERPEAERVARCLALAHRLRDSRGLDPVFAVQGDEAGARAIVEAGFRVERRPAHLPEALWLETLWALSGAGALVLDAESEIAQTDIARWRAAGLVILSLDDASARRMSVDIAAYPGIEARGMDWFGFRGELVYGPECRLTEAAGVVRLSGMLATRIGATALS